jgi:transcriptional regulator with GAF, ATPase, and Fis domain
MDKATKPAGRGTAELRVTTAQKNDRNENLAPQFFDFLSDYFRNNGAGSLKAIEEDIEKRIIVRVLRETGGNQKEAASVLGIKPTTLNYKIKKHGLCIRRVVYLSPEGEEA